MLSVSSMFSDSDKCSSSSTCDCSSCTSHTSDTSYSSHTSHSSPNSVLSPISTWPEWPNPKEPSHNNHNNHKKHKKHHNNPPCHNPGNECRDPYPRYDPGVAMFTSVVTPVSGLTPLYSGVTGSVEFRMRRKNKTVILQWEPFTGTMAASGVAFLTVAQSISNTPPYPVSDTIYIQYRGTDRPVRIVIDPNARGSNIRIYLNTDGSTTNITTGDSFQVYGGNTEWIVD